MKKTTPRRGRERRGSERAQARLSMRVEAVTGSVGAQGHAGGQALPSLAVGRIVTESQNISSSGVYCHASHYLAPLSKVQITIILPRVPGGETQGQELLKCDGIVVRCDQRPSDRSDTPYELACMFTRLDPSLRQRVEEFVTWRNLQALRAALVQGQRKGAGPTPSRPAPRPDSPLSAAGRAARSGTGEPPSRGPARLAAQKSPQSGSKREGSKSESPRSQGAKIQGAQSAQGSQGSQGSKSPGSKGGAGRARG